MPGATASMEPASEADYLAMESQAPATPAAAGMGKLFMLLVKHCSINVVDSCIAASGLVFAGIVLRLIDLSKVLPGIPLFNGAMLTMAIVWFANPAPPPYKVFLQCTIGAWFLGFFLKFMMLESVMVTIIVAGCLLIFFKTAKVMFPPSLGVAVFLISDQTLMPPAGSGPLTFAMFALKWLVTDWLIGSIWFYGVAKATSTLRATVKTKLSLLKFVANFADKTDAELIQSFKEIDADGGGALDNTELVQAWQKATGEELTPEQAQELIDEVDEDKNGTLDQNEFIALIRKRCERPLTSYSEQFSDAKLVELFEMYDDDGNNEMDADELVVAWKKATDKKITTAQAQALIAQGATNGNSTLDKDEFVQVVRAHA